MTVGIRRRRWQDFFISVTYIPVGMFGDRDRRRSDSDLYMKLPGSAGARKKSDDKKKERKSLGGGVVVRTDELTALHGVVSPRRRSVPFDLDAEHFLRSSRPVCYTYPDSPANTRARRAAGIEKEAGTVVGIPGAFQHRGAGGETIVSEENLNVCLVACLKHLMGRVEDLEQVVKELRAEKDMTQSGNWSVQGIGRAAAETFMRRA